MKCILAQHFNKRFWNELLQAQTIINERIKITNLLKLKYSKKIIITLLLNVKTILAYNNRINIKQQTIDMWILNKLKSNDGFIESLKQCLTLLNVIWMH